MRQAGIGFVFLFLFCLSVTVHGQDRLAIEQGDKDREVNKSLTVDKKFAGRLPNGYRDVVSSSQKEEVYKIQKDYFETIELLKARIALLESERNSKIDGLLTDEQRTKLRTNASQRNNRRGQ